VRCLLVSLLLILLVLWVLLELITLRILTMVPFSRWSLVPLLEALLRVGVLTSIASSGPSLHSLPLSIHLLALAINHNNMVHKRLVIGVCNGHQLELETIIQTLLKETLFISIIGHIVWSIT